MPFEKIENVTKKKSVAVSVEVADSEVSRMRGLMFRSKIVPILFVFGSPGIYPIHSYFVKAEFDAIYLSGSGIIVEIFRKIKPNVPLVTPSKKALYLLELPPAVTDRLGMAVGDRITWGK